MSDKLPSIDVEFIAADEAEIVESKSVPNRNGALLLLIFVALTVGLIALISSESEQDASNAEDETDEAADDEAPPISQPRLADRLDAVRVAQAIPPALLAAELYGASPNPEALREVFIALGGFDAITVATAEGAFDLVRFDPLNPDRLLAANRLSYGDGENQDVNELWTVGDDVGQTLWAPTTKHDFAHFNKDGTITMWVHGGGTGFAPRIARLLGGDFAPISSTDPIYASRFAASNGKLFALTGNGDYYTNDEGYVDLIVDDGDSQTILARGADYGWLDNPIPELLIAYPESEDGQTSVWDVASLEPLRDHPLADRPYARIAISGDQKRAIGITFEGDLEEVDLETGAVISTFGSVDPDGIDQAVTINNDGTIAITVEHDGLLTIWWVGENRPIATAEGDSAQPRWVSEEYAARSASVVATDASRVAIRIAAEPGVSTRWQIINTDTAAWLQLACEEAGRSLSNDERMAIGLIDREPVCT